MIYYCIQKYNALVDLRHLFIYGGKKRICDAFINAALKIYWTTDVILGMICSGINNFSEWTKLKSLQSNCFNSS